MFFGTSEINDISPPYLDRLIPSQLLVILTHTGAFLLEVCSCDKYGRKEKHRRNAAYWYSYSQK